MTKVGFIMTYMVASFEGVDAFLPGIVESVLQQIGVLSTKSVEEHDVALRIGGEGTTTSAGFSEERVGADHDIVTNPTSIDVPDQRAVISDGMKEIAEFLGSSTDGIVMSALWPTPEGKNSWLMTAGELQPKLKFLGGVPTDSEIDPGNVDAFNGMLERKQQYIVNDLQNIFSDDYARWFQPNTFIAGVVSGHLLQANGQMLKKNENIVVAFKTGDYAHVHINTGSDPDDWIPYYLLGEASSIDNMTDWAQAARKVLLDYDDVDERYHEAITEIFDAIEGFSEGIVGGASDGAVISDGMKGIADFLESSTDGLVLSRLWVTPEGGKSWRMLALGVTAGFMTAEEDDLQNIFSDEYVSLFPENTFIAGVVYGLGWLGNGQLLTQRNTTIVVAFKTGDYDHVHVNIGSGSDPWIPYNLGAAAPIDNMGDWTQAARKVLLDHYEGVHFDDGVEERYNPAINAIFDAIEGVDGNDQHAPDDNIIKDIEFSEGRVGADHDTVTNSTSIDAPDQRSDGAVVSDGMKAIAESLTAISIKEGTGIVMSALWPTPEGKNSWLMTAAELKPKLKFLGGVPSEIDPGSVDEFNGMLRQNQQYIANDLQNIFSDDYVQLFANNTFIAGVVSGHLLQANGQKANGENLLEKSENIVVAFKTGDYAHVHVNTGSGRDPWIPYGLLGDASSINNMADWALAARKVLLDYDDVDERYHEAITEILDAIEGVDGDEYTNVEGDVSSADKQKEDAAAAEAKRRAERIAAAEAKRQEAAAAAEAERLAAERKRINSQKPAWEAYYKTQQDAKKRAEEAAKQAELAALSARFPAHDGAQLAKLYADANIENGIVFARPLTGSDSTRRWGVTAGALRKDDTRPVVLGGFNLCLEGTHCTSGSHDLWQSLINGNYHLWQSLINGMTQDSIDDVLAKNTQYTTTNLQDVFREEFVSAFPKGTLIAAVGDVHDFPYRFEDDYKYDIGIALETGDFSAVHYHFAGSWTRYEFDDDVTPPTNASEWAKAARERMSEVPMWKLNSVDQNKWESNSLVIDSLCDIIDKDVDAAEELKKRQEADAKERRIFAKCYYEGTNEFKCKQGQQCDKETGTCSGIGCYSAFECQRWGTGNSCVNNQCV